MDSQAFLSAAVSSPPSAYTEHSLVNRSPRSLPLKKRKVLDSSTSNSNTKLVKVLCENEEFSAPGPRSIELTATNGGVESGPFLALLMAAATSIGSPEPIRKMRTPSPEPTVISLPDQLSVDRNENVEHSTSSDLATQESHPMVVATTVQVVSPIQKQQQFITPSQVQECSKLFPSRQRLYRPPLLKPLPNGCHGRTSRNNSYCRRKPWHAGSKYCKLHYQQHTQSTQIAENGKVEDNLCSKTPVVAPSKLQHQDRRFTGLDGESPCQATTTRGKACSHISKNGTKYCHLHADYDSNPPPRRGNVTGWQNFTHCYDDSKLFERDSLVTTSSNSSEHLYLTQHVKQSDTNIINSKTRLSKPYLSPPYPLLSSISSDKWFNKAVLITVGPLANHTGNVVRWGNGWVTVQTNGEPGETGILHNRRSVELILMPQQGEKQDAHEGTND